MPDDDNIILIDCLKAVARVSKSVCGTMPRCADCQNLPDGAVVPQQDKRKKKRFWLGFQSWSSPKPIIMGGMTMLLWASDTSGGWIRSCGK